MTAPVPKFIFFSFGGKFIKWPAIDILISIWNFSSLFPSARRGTQWTVNCFNLYCFYVFQCNFFKTTMTDETEKNKNNKRSFAHINNILQQRIHTFKFVVWILSATRDRYTYIFEFKYMRASAYACKQTKDWVQAHTYKNTGDLQYVHEQE